MFDSQFGRQSIDGRGGTVSITVHYGRDYDNAFWDGLSSSLAMGMGRSLIVSPSRWMSWRTSSRTVSRSSPSDWLIRISQAP